jgi:hypothetical protein
MSAPKRYTAAGEGVVRTEPDGALVSFEDYAAIHYERIHDLNQIGGLQEENARLKAAGDSLYKSMLEIGCNEMANNFEYDAWWGSMKGWRAAKEGKPHA